LTFAFVAKRIFVQNLYGLFSLKSSHSHAKHFAQALNLKKRQAATQKWKLSLHMSQVVHQATWPDGPDDPTSYAEYFIVLK